MILSGKEILKQQCKGLTILPFDKDSVNPNSHNLKLHNESLVYDDIALDMKKDNPTRKIIIPSDGYVLEPFKLYLGRTHEYTITRNYVPVIEGRSSIGRLGMFVHVTAGFGDIGFAGYWTLEIMCIKTIRIYPMTKICQISYHTIEGEYDLYSSDKYQKNSGIQGSKIFKEFGGDVK